MGEGGLDDGIEALWVNPLHELEALEGRVGDGGPPNGAGVVDEDVEAAIFLTRLMRIESMKEKMWMKDLPRLFGQ